MGISTIKSKLKRGLALTQKESGDLWEYIRSLEKQQRKALEQTELNPSYNGVKSELKPSEDYISREEALRHRHIIYDDDGVGYSVVRVDEIEQLPSVTPQQTCEDCISRTKLLSRIDAERKHLLDLKMDGAEHIIVHHARRIIEDMPSVTPQAESEDKE